MLLLLVAGYYAIALISLLGLAVASAAVRIGLLPVRAPASPIPAAPPREDQTPEAAREA